MRCTAGSIFDVVVDLRHGSSTYGHYKSAILTSENMCMMYVPRGFAHGFMTLELDTEITYLVSAPYNKCCENTLLWSGLQIEWPAKPSVISDKDKKGLKLKNFHPVKVD